jgi:uncharacterized protein (TIGR00661 family)
MIGKEFNNYLKQPRLLIAPLDWGLGHTTRCIPLIRELQNIGCEIIIAGLGNNQQILQQEFPQIKTIPLPGYGIRYSRKKAWLPFKIILQLPKLAISIFREHQWLKKTVKEYRIDAIISDNRFGLYHSAVPSVYITHQLQIKSGNRLIEKLLQRIHYRFIKKYKQCWIPDFISEENMAGALSHPSVLPGNIQYLGCLSRFEMKTGIEKKYDLLVIISGPEPQRSIFEKIMLDQLEGYVGNVLLVRGMPEEKVTPDIKNKFIQIVNHIPAEEMNRAIQQSKLVISRSGYTTIMDLVKLQQRAILVATPGQTEQAYLAEYLMNKKIFYSVEQDNFTLAHALRAADSFPFHFPAVDMEQYKMVLQQFVQML